MRTEKKYLEIAPGIFVTSEQLKKLNDIKRKKAKEEEATTAEKKKSN